MILLLTNTNYRLQKYCRKNRFINNFRATKSKSDMANVPNRNFKDRGNQERPEINFNGANFMKWSPQGYLNGRLKPLNR